MWKYNCQKANKMFVLIKFIIMFAVRLEPLKKIDYAKEYYFSILPQLLHRGFSIPRSKCNCCGFFI